jgi:hypothetical protein
MRGVLRILLILASEIVMAQTPAPVVISSVKRTADLDEGIKGNFVQGGVYRVSNAPLTVLLQTAYASPRSASSAGPTGSHTTDGMSK